MKLYTRARRTENKSNPLQRLWDTGFSSGSRKFVVFITTGQVRTNTFSDWPLINKEGRTRRGEGGSVVNPRNGGHLIKIIIVSFLVIEQRRKNI